MGTERARTEAGAGEVTILPACPADGIQAACHFLESWFGNCDGLVELRCLTPHCALQEFFALTHLEKMADRAVELSRERAEVYFGCATRVKVRGRPRGRNADVLHIPGLWCDLDFSEVDGIDVMERLESFRPRPTQIVHSGGGLHVYWKLVEPGLPTPQRRAMLRAVTRALGADPAATDFARVLRVPGTWSWKRELPVRLLDCRCLWTRTSLICP